LVQVYDVGKAINPTLVEGQIDGGAMMGLGLGLLEACYPYYPSTAHRGGEFGTYLAPSMEQLPEIQYVILEHASEDGPFRAKAIGEMASNSQSAAIATAVHDAIGVWIRTPITRRRSRGRSSARAPARTARAARSA
jgi:CO/xanthine dehydrogenase Mo-binding subunit